jgi:hypothetical protein
VVAQAGSATIDTQLFIKFVDNPKTYYMNIKGARIGQFYVHTPNWSEGITVERRFLTSVFPSQNMTETRRVLRDKPVRSMQSTIPFFTKKDAGRMWSSLRDFSKQQTAQPWYPDQSSMTQAPDTNRIYCVTEFRRFQVGKYAFIIKDNNIPTTDKHFEMLRIAEVFVDGFSTDDAVVGSYTTSDFVYPAFICYASMEGRTQELMTDDKAVIDMTADEVYGASMLDIENAGYSPVIRTGYPVLDLTLTFSELPEITVLHGGDTKDSGRGIVQAFRGVPFIEQTATAICKTKEECWDAVGFFNYLKGRGKVFWAKSELDFLSIVSTSTNTSFTIDNPNTLAEMAYLKYVWVQDSAGDFDVLAVTGIADDAGNTKISIDSNSLADISRVWQAHAVRLAEDVITEEYLTDGKMLATFTVQELQGV